MTEENTQSTDLDLDLPDFDNLGNTTDTQDSPLDLNFDDNTSSSSSGSDDLNFDLDLPDFDTTASSESATSSDSLSDTSYLDDLDFDDLDDSTTQNKSQSTGKGLSFTGLYDKETEMGNSAASYDGDGGKNSRASVIICVLCAIICVLATLFVIMVIPQKFNVFGNKKGQETAKTEITELPDVKEAAQKNKAFAEEPAAEPIPAPAPLPPVPEAKEEEVVVIENAEDVVPLPPPVTPVKPKDITYKIKWGDTLWDISETYYKNPWRYKYIARYNGIKNPDYIVSGTFIQIPAE